VTSTTQVSVRATSNSKNTIYGTTTLTIDPRPVVTGVSVTSGSSSLASGASTTLTANVSGYGSFNSSVTWSVVSGGGSLSGTTGSPVTYNAPTVSNYSTVVIRATSTQNTAKLGEFTFTIVPPLLLPDTACDVNWRPRDGFDVWKDDNAGGLNLGAHRERCRTPILVAGLEQRFWW
jgi:hypothetical protein